jgi:hypothetical protein
LLNTKIELKGERRKMQLSNKSKTALAIALIFTLSITTEIAFLPNTKAADISGTITAYAFLQCVPQQIGLGQSVFIVMWIDKPPTTASGPLGDRWTNFYVNITQPDKTLVKFGPFQSDDAGGYTAIFTPTQLGNYSAVFSFPGETLTGSQGNPGNPNITPAVGDVFSSATSSVEMFTVSQTPASIIPENPLPTNYWQAPVEAFNHYWNVIDGNWLGFGAVEFANTGNYAFMGNYNPYTTAPTTAHILWTTPLVPGSPGGQLGGEFGSSEEANYFSGFQYQPKFAPIVMNGVLYYEGVPNYSSGGPYQGWVARDLRTGTILWTRNYLNYFASGSNDILMCGQIYVYKTPNTYGGQTFLWATRSTSGINYLDVFDGATGNYILSINGSGTAGAFGRPNIEGSDGSLLQYYINASSGRQSLTFWNSSVCLNPTNSQFWGPPQNAVIPYSQGIVWSTLLPNTYQGNSIGANFILDGVGHGVIDPDNQIAIVTAAQGQYAGYGFNTGWILEAAYDLKTGAQLWIKNQTEPQYTTEFLIPGANSGVYVEFDKQLLTWSGYSTLTGQKVWGPTDPYANPLGYYDQTSAVAAEGALYTWTFGGWVYKYNMTNGNLIWSWNTGSTGLNTPYGVNPLWIIGNYEATLAGGLFFVETGHCYGPPLFSGAQLYAINATSGELVWSITNFDSGSCPAVVFGQVLTFNAYDNQIYSYGIGPTKTTVNAPSVGVTTSTPVTITGTVTDISSGSQQTAVAANFPNGLPAVSDESMTKFMESVYMQMPTPHNTTGVPVTLSVIDSNHNYRIIGTTTTDPSGAYGFTWTPDIPGGYQLIATFGGSGAYYGSTAQTYFYASTPAATASPVPVAAEPPTGMYIAEAAAAIIVVIIIVGVVLAFLMLRKRP